MSKGHSNAVERQQLEEARAEVEALKKRLEQLDGNVAVLFHQLVSDNAAQAATIAAQAATIADLQAAMAAAAQPADIVDMAVQVDFNDFVAAAGPAEAEEDDDNQAAPVAAEVVAQVPIAEPVGPPVVPFHEAPVPLVEGPVVQDFHVQLDFDAEAEAGAAAAEAPAAAAEVGALPHPGNVLFHALEDVLHVEDALAVFFAPVADEGDDDDEDDEAAAAVAAADAEADDDMELDVAVEGLMQFDD